MTSGSMEATPHRSSRRSWAAGPHAASAHRLFIFMLAVSVIVYVVVGGAFLLVIRDRRRDAADRTSPSAEATAGRTIRLAFVVIIPVLFIFLIYDFVIGHSMSAMHESSMLTVDVTGRQWWWDVA